ncbi:MAG: MoaD/ThiS family protein [Myxococcota bacterium]|nr:MoaD/ThiS family protein [Myxococcota bacterium]
MITIRIPTSLRSETGGRSEVAVDAASVRGALDALIAAHPGLKPRLLDEQGAVRRYVNVFLNDEDIRFLRVLDSPLQDRDTLTLIPAMAGG